MLYQLHQGDMSDFNLGRSFDLVTSFLASIADLPDVQTMRRSIACMAKHLAPAESCSWSLGSLRRCIAKTRWCTISGARPSVRVSWIYVMRPRGSVAVWEIHWLVGTAADGVRHFVETEELSLFSTGEAIGAMRDAGLDVVHDTRGLHGYGAMVARAERWSADEIAAIHAALAN